MLLRFVIPMAMVLCVVGTLGQDLEFVTTPSHFAPGRYQAAVVYDGADSIYSVGGYIEKIGELPHWTQDVFRYSLTDGSVELIDRTFRNANQGAAIWAGNSSIYYFGGEVHAALAVSDIWKLPTSGPRNMTVVNNLPLPTRHSAVVFDGVDSAYVIGGSLDETTNHNSIVRYSISGNVVEEVASLLGARRLSSAVMDTATGAVYILGGFNETYPGYYGYDEILKFEPAQGTVTKLEAKLPVALWGACGVWTGKEVYLLAPITNGPYLDLTRFNPSTGEVTTLSVNNIPGGISGVGCAYVEKLNRIYAVGGFNFDTSFNYWDTISYIQL